MYIGSAFNILAMLMERYNNTGGIINDKATAPKIITMPVKTPSLEVSQIIKR